MPLVANKLFFVYAFVSLRLSVGLLTCEYHREPQVRNRWFLIKGGRKKCFTKTKSFWIPLSKKKEEKENILGK